MTTEQINDQVTMGKKVLSDGNSRFLHFSLGKEQFAIPLLTVKEVIAVPEMTQIPATPKHFLGIMNLRGQVISVIDLRLKLGVTSSQSAETAVIICDIGGMTLGVLVDSVNAVLHPREQDLSEKPQVESKANEYITCVYRKDKDLILFLDIARVLDAGDHSALRRASNAASPKAA